MAGARKTSGGGSELAPREVSHWGGEFPKPRLQGIEKGGLLSCKWKERWDNHDKNDSVPPGEVKGVSSC